MWSYLSDFEVERLAMHRWLMKRRWTFLGYLALVVVVYMMLDVPQREEEAEQISRVRKFGRKQLQVIQYDVSSMVNSETGNEAKVTTDKRKLDLSDKSGTEQNPKEQPKVVERPPILVYVYELPEKFTADLMPCSRNYSFSTNGSKDEVEDIRNNNIRRSNLELMLHWKFNNTKYRTNNPAEADVFYIPFYPSLACSCHKTTGLNLTKLHNMLWRHLTEVLPYFQDGVPTRPHFMALGSTERQHWTKNCPLLRDQIHSRGITFIGVEKENNANIRNYSGREFAPMIIAPYPSYKHFEVADYVSADDFINPGERKNLVFFYDDPSKVHKVRNILKKEIGPTSLSFNEVLKTRGFADKSSARFVGSDVDLNKTFDWMKHSTFCFVPPANTQIQRTFYDAILSGCIPVTFYPKKRNSNKVEYPFERNIEYYRTTLNVPIEEVLSGDKNTTWFLGTIPRLKIKIVQRRIFELAPKVGYSSKVDSNDAFDMIIKEIIRFSS